MKFILNHFGKKIQESLLEEGREYFVGRHSDCDFVLEEGTSLSRKHIKIYQSAESGNWIVESISEWGGLFLEGEEIQSVEIEQACQLTLKNYGLMFIPEQKKTEEQQHSQNLSESLEDKKPSPSESLNLEEDVSKGTKIFNDSHLVYSLHISIAGEFSSHVNLNEGENWIIGRSEECDVCIDYSILTRKHIQILKQNQQFYVKDLGSANKTLLNSSELKPHKEVPLKANDEISVSDLQIVFEVRNTNYEQMMSNLPDIVSEDSNELENFPEMPAPKVVLEESPSEEEQREDAPSKFLNKKRSILLVLLFVLGGALYYKYETNKKRKRELAEEQKAKGHKNKLEVFYQEAVNHLEQEKYQFCIEQLKELHQSSSTGYFKDSQQLLIQCQSGLTAQKQKAAQIAAEEQERKTKEEIKKITDECQKKFDQKEIQSLEDLSQCARPLESLDPENPIISSIRTQIEEKETLKLMAQEKRQAYKKFLQGKRALYNKAKKIRDQNKPLRAVSAYNVFLKSAKGIPALKDLWTQAESERDTIQKAYDDELNKLYSSCENLIESKKMKEAYYDCKKILKFKSEDKQAKNYIQQALSSLKKELKPLYEQSMWHESFSRIEEATKLWKEILEKDVQNGYYYKKAQSQIKKYK